MQTYLRFGKLSFTLVLAAGVCLLARAFGQVPVKSDTTVYTIVERQPQFPGGMESLHAYIDANLRYPVEAQKAGVKGRVFVSFIVEQNGILDAVTVFRGLGYGCDEEAIRVVRGMPRWVPGSQSGRPLRVKYNLPFRFGEESVKRKGH